jgi:hypothetical protein
VRAAGLQTEVEADARPGLEAKSKRGMAQRAQPLGARMGEGVPELLGLESKEKSGLRGARQPEASARVAAPTEGLFRKTGTMTCFLVEKSERMFRKTGIYRQGSLGNV